MHPSAYVFRELEKFYALAHILFSGVALFAAGAAMGGASERT
jgi:hypothetical protein